jgi:hypothetical protein
MSNPIIAITGNISVGLFGDINNGGYIFWINNHPAVEINIRSGIVSVVWNTPNRTDEKNLIPYITQYNDRLSAAIERGAWPRKDT